MRKKCLVRFGYTERKCCSHQIVSEYVEAEQRVWLHGTRWRSCNVTHLRWRWRHRRVNSACPVLPDTPSFLTEIVLAFSCVGRTWGRMQEQFWSKSESGAQRSQSLTPRQGKWRQLSQSLRGHLTILFRRPLYERWRDDMSACELKSELYSLGFRATLPLYDERESGARFECESRNGAATLERKRGSESCRKQDKYTGCKRRKCTLFNRF
jgi:hypothetical protein